ncbi:MAG: terminase family protein [Candidatus Competibacter sp.]|nr:terminase family protein [Candidatus Competibacter sp.]MDG4606462.1 terminase family protein [Candidatus Contendobacter sp.]MDS4059286.1 terminase family protein [Candidatus Contendobacter sp.]HRD49781.1 terminase family protein [Candidatus Contendobacter sp.]
MFSRQTGKTFTATLEIILHCLAAEAQGKKARWVILSRGERQAKEAMEEGCKRHLQALNIAFNALEKDFDAHTKALEITLPGGSRMTALPANPDTARGFSANVLLDEFAFHADSRKIWQALFPVISAGHFLRVVSTPNGKGNKFYELMTDASLDQIWSRHVVDIHQAVAQGLPRDIAELKAGIGDDDAWAQEYELKWLDEASAWLSYDLINRCEDEAATVERASSPYSVHGLEARSTVAFLGVDIGARHDLFVIWVLEAVGDVLWTREVIARQRISFAEQDALLDDCFQRYRVIRCCMDQTGMGEKPVEDAQRRHGSRIEGVIFTAANKQHLATVAKDAFEDRRVRIPKGQREIRDDLHKLQKVTSPTGAPRFVADRDSDGHADRAWALFLALYAAAAPVIDFRQIQTAARDTPASDHAGWGTVAGSRVTHGW